MRQDHAAPTWRITAKAGPDAIFGLKMPQNWGSRLPHFRFRETLTPSTQDNYLHNFFMLNFVPCICGLQKP